MDCSDKPRRSLSDALRTGEVTEEALAFVAGKTPRPRYEQTPAAQPSPVILPVDGPRPDKASPTTLLSNNVPNFQEPPVLSAGTISITVRLPGALASRLLRASLERKLRRELPFTQQDIVAEALAQWLQQHGYGN